MKRIDSGRTVVLFLIHVLVFSAGVSAQDEQGSELVPLVINLLNEQDSDMRALGLEQVRTQAPGKAATEQFAAQLSKLSPDAQVGLIRALAVRGDNAARPAVLELLDASSNEPVRLAAIESLGWLGDGADLELLVSLLADGTTAEKAAARSSLVRLPGSGVPPAIASRMTKTNPTVQSELIEILAERRALDTIPNLLQAALDDEPRVRTAAMAALGELAGPAQMPGMLQGILRAERGRERDAAEKAVMRVCQRIPEADQQAQPILDAMKRLSQADQVTMLSTLGRVGGAGARQTVEQALADRDSATHDAGLRALSNWPDASVAPRLIELAKTDPHSGHRTTALRALIRIAPLNDGRSDIERLQLLQQAMAMCQRDQERNLVLQRAQAIRIPETLRFVLPYLDQPAYAKQACETVVELAHHRQLREPNKAEFDRALDQVIAISKDATILDRAQRYKKGQTWAGPIGQ